MNLPIIISLIPLVTVGIGGGYITYDWAVTIEKRVSMNTQQIQQDAWFILDAKKKKGFPLSKGEWIKWCAWGKRQGFIETCGRPPSGVPRQPRRKR